MIRVLILLTFLCISCGSPEDSSGVKRGAQKFEPKLETYSKVSFDCFSEGQCTNSFVLSINSSQDYPKYCTAYMADSRNMIVPYSCVRGAQCSELAAKTVDGKVYKCESIEVRRDENHPGKTFNGEFAKIKLTEDVVGSFSNISEKPFGKYQRYNLWYVIKKYDNSGYLLKRSRYSCRKTRNNILFPGNEEQRAVVAMKNCITQEASIGAGVTDTATGDVLGLVHGLIKNDFTYRSFMSGNRGNSLSLATPIKCALNNFNLSAFGDSEYCAKPVFKSISSSFSKDLRKIFSFPNSDEEFTHVFSRRFARDIGDNKTRISREFFALKFSNGPYSGPKIKVCKFRPFLSTSYEVYNNGRISRCEPANLDYVLTKTHYANYLTIYDDYGSIAIKIPYN